MLAKELFEKQFMKNIVARSSFVDNQKVIEQLLYTNRTFITGKPKTVSRVGAKKIA